MGGQRHAPTALPPNDPKVISPISKSVVLSVALTCEPHLPLLPPHKQLLKQAIYKDYIKYTSRTKRKDYGNSEQGRVNVKVKVTL